MIGKFLNGSASTPKSKSALREDQPGRISRKMSKVFLVIFVLAILPTLAASQGKVVYIPDNVKVEKNAFKATTILDLSEIEIYSSRPINLIDDFIYLLDRDNYRVVKLSLQGKLVAQFGKKGAGPGEFLAFSGISRFKENIAVTGRHKVVILDKNLKYLREVKLKQRFHGLILANNNRIYFYNNPSYSNYYFTVYTEDFKPLRKFGIKNPNAKDTREKIITHRNYRHSWDQVRKIFYVPEENGFWVSFWNRYDLRYYKDEKVVVDIKPKRQIYASYDDEFSGVKVKSYSDYSLLIGKHENRLYYCFKLGDDRFCDVFDLSKNYRLIRRLKFPFRYKKLVLHNASLFYGFRYNTDAEVLLDKIQLTGKSRQSNKRH